MENRVHNVGHPVSLRPGWQGYFQAHCASRPRTKLLLTECHNSQKVYCMKIEVTVASNALVVILINRQPTLEGRSEHSSPHFSMPYINLKTIKQQVFDNTSKLRRGPSIIKWKTYSYQLQHEQIFFSSIPANSIKPPKQNQEKEQQIEWVTTRIKSFLVRQLRLCGSGRQNLSALRGPCCPPSPGNAAPSHPPSHLRYLHGSPSGFLLLPRSTGKEYRSYEC